MSNKTNKEYGVRKYNNFELVISENVSELILELAKIVDLVLDIAEIKKNLPRLKTIEIRTFPETYICTMIFCSPEYLIMVLDESFEEKAKNNGKWFVEYSEIVSILKSTSNLSEHRIGLFLHFHQGIVNYCADITVENYLPKSLSRWKGLQKKELIKKFNEKKEKKGMWRYIYLTQFMELASYGTQDMIINNCINQLSKEEDKDFIKHLKLFYRQSVEKILLNLVENIRDNIIPFVPALLEKEKETYHLKKMKMQFQIFRLSLLF